MKFLAGLKTLNSEALIEFFAKNAQLTDASGRRSDREEILRNFEKIFALYAKRSSAPMVEATLGDTDDLFVASVLWEARDPRQRAAHLGASDECCSDSRE